MNERNKSYFLIAAGILFILIAPEIAQRVYGWNFFDIEFLTSEEGRSARRIIWTLRGIGGIIAGYGTGLLGKMKGYIFSWSFVMGFIFNILGVIIVLMLPDKNLQETKTVAQRDDNPAT